jgi:hypothetical protein
MDCGGALSYDPLTNGPPKAKQRRCPKCVDKILFSPEIMKLAEADHGE